MFLYCHHSHCNRLAKHWAGICSRASITDCSHRLSHPPIALYWHGMRGQRERNVKERNKCEAIGRSPVHVWVDDPLAVPPYSPICRAARSLKISSFCCDSFCVFREPRLPPSAVWSSTIAPGPSPEGCRDCCHVNGPRRTARVLNQRFCCAAHDYLACMTVGGLAGWLATRHAECSHPPFLTAQCRRHLLFLAWPLAPERNLFFLLPTRRAAGHSVCYEEAVLSGLMSHQLVFLLYSRRSSISKSCDTFPPQRRCGPHWLRFAACMAAPHCKSLLLPPPYRPAKLQALSAPAVHSRPSLLGGNSRISSALTETGLLDVMDF
ncbi:hypothetical protein DL89DRAFT_29844 [Linderina pennispora]|uniref:Uncharacterized protein n=1 Tax=Linderina pennispora TaxID=61395 RepID=A0A1Y1W4X1_9FUNG|nr:uncharacterized protein DL89DRAFT_29844 [Linderina pennispora]ORX68266.1 hypothetical protein DL89DRAFT_29844 [Linderina pennispora]